MGAPKERRPRFLLEAVRISIEGRGEPGGEDNDSENPEHDGTLLG